ncbi:DUF3558 family protein [Pseudonocardia sediminis]|uniref:DUF3558 family protein n=1 Tax=Pseudonocardia sediminis TaxID=1397368 RepID=UPI0013EF17E1|nr:DUF3558 family protein [Pseudonocardia sediminis]
MAVPAGLLCWLVLAAGCSPGEPPAPVPVTAGASPGRNAADDAATVSGAPRVTVPRDPGRLAGCHPSTELLGPGLVVPSTASPTTGAAGSGCSWTGPSPSGTGRGFLLRADVRAAGLDGTHRARDLFRAFRTGEVDGLPSVVTSPEGDPSCSLHVATSDDTSLTVQVGPVPDPCAVATRAASRLLAALPPR